MYNNSKLAQFKW